MRAPSRIGLYRLLRRIAGHEDEKRGKSGIAKAAVQATYVSGNPTIQQAHESASTAGSKRHRIIQPVSNRTGALTANQSIAIGYDGDNNRIVAGQIVDLSSYVLDADLVMGLRPVAPGNTVLASADTEQSTTSATYVKVKEFFATRPGRYRLGFELSRSGGQTDAIVRMLRPDGSYIDASATASYVSTVYTTFGAFNLDMTISAWWGAQIAVFLRNTSGPAQTGYIKNCKLKFSDASAALVPYDATLVD